MVNQFVTNECHFRLPAVFSHSEQVPVWDEHTVYATCVRLTPTHTWAPAPLAFVTFHLERHQNL